MHANAATPKMKVLGSQLLPVYVCLIFTVTVSLVASILSWMNSETFLPLQYFLSLLKITFLCINTRY